MPVFGYVESPRAVACLSDAAGDTDPKKCSEHGRTDIDLYSSCHGAVRERVSVFVYVRVEHALHLYACLDPDPPQIRWMQLPPSTHCSLSAGARWLFYPVHEKFAQQLCWQGLFQRDIDECVRWQLTKISKELGKTE